MNLEELIKKYLGEWMNAGAHVRVEYYSDNVTPWMISFFNNANEMNYSTEVCCHYIENGMQIIRERLQKG